MKSPTEKRDLILNVTGTIGLALVAVGTCIYSIALGFVVTGSILLALAIVGAIMK